MRMRVRRQATAYGRGDGDRSNAPPDAHRERNLSGDGLAIAGCARLAKPPNREGHTEELPSTASRLVYSGRARDGAHGCDGLSAEVFAGVTNHIKAEGMNLCVAWVS